MTSQLKIFQELPPAFGVNWQLSVEPCYFPSIQPHLHQPLCSRSMGLPAYSSRHVLPQDPSCCSSDGHALLLSPCLANSTCPSGLSLNSISSGDLLFLSSFCLVTSSSERLRQGFACLSAQWISSGWMNKHAVFLSPQQVPQFQRKLLCTYLFNVNIPTTL